jgi:3-oxoacyl-[acyl-carrier protein] reductase
MNMINTEVPLRRFGQPGEIADLVVFLASDRAAFITGSCVIADGGQTRSL